MPSHRPNLLKLSLSLALLAGPFGTTQAAPAPGELVIALPANVNTLDPHQTATVETDLSVISHLYLPVLARTSDMKLAPGVARTWRALNATTWQFELTPGLAFSNGEKLDAEVIKWNIERILDPRTASRVKSWYDSIAEVKVVSPTVVQVVTRAPYPALPEQFTMLYLLPPKWASQNNPSRAAVASGPYELKEFVSGDRVVLEARPNYGGQDKPAFTRVVFKPIPEASARVAAVMAGDVDAATQLLPADTTRINGSGKARAGSTPGARSVILKFNTLKGPFKDNTALRQAINHAIDKEEIIRNLLGGAASPSTCQITTPSYFGYHPGLKPYAFDPQKARQLIARSGYRNQTIELEVPLGRYQQAQEIAQAVAAQLEDVGLKVKLVEMEFGSWINKYVKLGNLGDSAVLGQAWITLDAGGLLTTYHSTSEYAYWNNKEFDTVLEEARRTPDAARRAALYHKANEVMCREAPVAFLWTQPITYATSPRVQWKPRADELIRAVDFKPGR